MSKEKIQQISFASSGTTARSDWRSLPFDCLTRNRGNSGPTNVKHYLLGRRERYLIETSMSESKQMKSLKGGRGRPKSFDRTAAIQQAMELFWDRGYEGTTFDDLIRAMKLSPSSFYHEFS